jgi:sigma-B regulation protein RsbU (phosphoserine phosphatase)
VDLKTGRGMVSNAGHEHPALCRKGERFGLVEYKHSPALGVMPGIRFREHEISLEAGDRVFVYTDGVTEANNKEYELFGTERMLDALNSNPSGPVAAVLQNIRLAVDRFAGDEPQFDDLTMMLFEFKGPQGETMQEALSQNASG